MVPEICEAAQENLSRVLCGDLENMSFDFTPGYFDCIIFADILEHLKDPVPLLKQAVSLLKPGGRLVITTPHPFSDLPHRVLSFLHALSPMAQGEHHRLLGTKDLGPLADDLEMDLLCYKRFLCGMNQLAVFSYPE